MIENTSNNTLTKIKWLLLKNNCIQFDSDSGWLLVDGDEDGDEDVDGDGEEQDHLSILGI